MGRDMDEREQYRAILEDNQGRILLAVNNAGLQRGVKLAESKSLGHSAQRFHSGKMRRALHAADIQPFHIIRGLVPSSLVSPSRAASIILTVPPA